MTVEELVLEAEKLSGDEQKILASRLHLLLAKKAADSEERRRAAMRSFLQLGGAFHSDHADVSGDKYKHLADAYADDHEDS